MMIRDISGSQETGQGILVFPSLIDTMIDDISGSQNLAGILDISCYDMQ